MTDDGGTLARSGGPGTPPEAADRFASLWRGGSPPDLDGFLAGAGGLGPDDLAAVLRVDQASRWERGERPAAEDYLRRYPRVSTDANAALDLIYNEFLLRERRGERPSLEEFLGRFPEHASALRNQIELHLALETKVNLGDPGSWWDESVPPTRLGGPDDERELPEVFGRYRIQGKLARGGMGTVYVAYDTQLERRVALKVIHDPGGHLVRRFLREARIAASFSDPHLCSIYDVGEHEGLPFLTMPLLEGETLAARVARVGPLPRCDAIRIAARVARALALAHRAGVIHRDIKPANVMLDGRGEPIVLDFGLARRDTPGDEVTTLRGTFMGTPAYMAPEQIGGDPKAVGEACDIYSLGVVLYQMLTGRVPYSGPAHEILRQTVIGKPAPPSRHRADAGPRLDRICLTALAKRPGDRFPTMDAFADALETELRDEAAPSRFAYRPPRRAAWLIAFGVMAILGGGVAFVVSLTGTRRAAETAAPDPFSAGVTWSGTFVFRPPITNYSGDVEIKILERRPGWFRGDYRTEQGRYEWEIEGTTEAQAVRWEFKKAIKDNAEHSVVGHARVEGSIADRSLNAVFTNPGGGTADLRLTAK